MKTSAFTAADVAASVLAVPPLARHADLSLNVAANQALIAHMQAGGIKTLIYGGNANFYHVGMGEYAAILDMLAQCAGADTWMVPSAGPDYGKLMDQAAVLRDYGFPTVMVMPYRGVASADGIATGVRRFAERLGKPVLLYIKDEDYLPVETVGAMMDEGCVGLVKYAVIRQQPAQDEYLRALAARVDPRLIVSGIGERPAIDHLRAFGLGSFTTGSGTIAPSASMALLRAIQAGDWQGAQALRQRFLPLEDIRDAHGPIAVLHDAVTLSGIAPMGPMLPMLSNTDPSLAASLRSAACGLLEQERAAA
ncbi:dihydrodipicolinate synthase family protein [Orrella sp. JC864]|uniref:dihydrodipicolinate synthase family protein n=1 Tax=Orrella sp. JC864 TaxID=3120298 RepID=UPI0012BBD84B